MPRSSIPLLLRLLRLPPQNDISAPACIAAALISRPALRCAAAPLDCAGCISATPPRSKSTLRGSLSWHAAAGCPCSCTCGPRQQTFWILCSSMQVGWVGRGGQDRGQGRAAAGQGSVRLGSTHAARQSQLVPRSAHDVQPLVPQPLLFQMPSPREWFTPLTAARTSCNKYCSTTS